MNILWGLVALVVLGSFAWVSMRNNKNKIKSKSARYEEDDDEDDYVSGYRDVKLATYDFDYSYLSDEYKWRNLFGWTDVAGVNHYMKAAAKFLELAKKAEANSKPYGLLLEKEPDNQHDRNAIKVFGWVNAEGPQFHLGYVPRDVASSISGMPKDMPLACLLVSADSLSSGLRVRCQIKIPGKRDAYWKGRDDFPL